LVLAPSPQDCPHEQASLVKARTLSSASGVFCRRAVTLFGTQVGGTSGFCPKAKFFFPEHYRCLGEAAPHHRCVPAGFLPVLVQFCRCVEIGGQAFEIEFGACRCDAPLNAGAIHTDATESCQGGG